MELIITNKSPIYIEEGQNIYIYFESNQNIIEGTKIELLINDSSWGFFEVEIDSFPFLEPTIGYSYFIDIGKFEDSGFSYNTIFWIQLKLEESYSNTIELEFIEIIEQIILTPYKEDGKIAYEAFNQTVVELKANIQKKEDSTNLTENTHMKVLRAEAESDQLILIADLPISKDSVLFTFQDGTVESGVYYQYKLQFWDGETPISKTLDSNMIVLFMEDMVLGTNEKSLIIKYDPNISNYKYITAESFTQTLGAQFPFYRKNGNVKYRQFSIGGLISYHAEKERESSDFIDFDTDLAQFENLSYEQKDLIQERIFRDKVIAFLMDQQVKLFRSATEGNIIVRLTNINFTPNKTLGRKIYSFTAQATEVDVATLSNYKKYNLYNTKVINSF